MNEEEQLEEVEEAAPVEEAAAEEFEFHTKRPEINFQTERVPPPAWLYVGPGDRLWVVAWNSASPGSVRIHVRLLLPNGEISANFYDMPLTDDRARNEFNIPLVESFLLSVSVSPAGVMRGATCWVRILLVAGGGGGTWFPQGIVCGYIVGGSTLTWPYPRFQNPVEGPGRLRVIVGTDPAPGFEILEAVPGGARWRLLALKATLVTSAVVGDRFVHLYFDDGATEWWRGSALFTQVTGYIANYNWAIGVDARSGLPPSWIQDALPAEITLAAGWRFRTETVGREPGDNWAAPVYYVEEWVEP